MIVISNHAQKLGIELPKEAVIRINVAWVENESELRKILEENKENRIWLDYPTGRTKPPQPKLTLAQCIKFCKNTSNIVFFAFSNAEDTNIVELIRHAVPSAIILVPKIETIKGVNNVLDIASAARTKTIMFDKEDLYTDVKADIVMYETLSRQLRETCKKNDIKCLELKGVIFA